MFLIDTTAWVSAWQEATGGPEMFQGWVFTPHTIEREDRALITVRDWTLLHSLKITEVPISTLYVTSHLPRACVLPPLTETWPADAPDSPPPAEGLPGEEASP